VAGGAGRSRGTSTNDSSSKILETHRNARDDRGQGESQSRTPAARRKRGRGRLVKAMHRGWLRWGGSKERATGSRQVAASAEQLGPRWPESPSSSVSAFQDRQLNGPEAGARGAMADFGPFAVHHEVSRRRPPDLPPTTERGLHPAWSPGRPGTRALIDFSGCRDAHTLKGRPRHGGALHPISEIAAPAWEGHHGAQSGTVSFAYKPEIVRRDLRGTRQPCGPYLGPRTPSPMRKPAGVARRQVPGAEGRQHGSPTGSRPGPDVAGDAGSSPPLGCGRSLAGTPARELLQSGPVRGTPAWGRCPRAGDFARARASG